MSIPLIAGPGAISTAIIYSTKTTNWTTNALLSGVLLVVMGSVLAVLLVGHKVRRWVGDIGLDIVTRLFGLILAGIAAQLIIEGLGEAFPAWLEPGSPIQDDLEETGAAGA